MTNARTIDLRESDLRIVQDIVSKFLPGRSVFVFGSRVTGLARRCSDLDLAITGEPLTLREEALLSYAFEESDLSVTVDVTPLVQATGIFRRRIEQELTPLPPRKQEPATQNHEQVAA